METNNIENQHQNNEGSPVVLWMDKERKTAKIDGVLYIRSWRGRKEPKPRWSKEQRRHYMKQYRVAKKEQLKKLQGFYDEHNK